MIDSWLYFVLFCVVLYIFLNCEKIENRKNSLKSASDEKLLCRHNMSRLYGSRLWIIKKTKKHVSRNLLQDLEHDLVSEHDLKKYDPKRQKERGPKAIGYVRTICITSTSCSSVESEKVETRTKMTFAPNFEFRPQPRWLDCDMLAP